MPEAKTQDAQAQETKTQETQAQEQQAQRSKASGKWVYAVLGALLALAGILTILNRGDANLKHALEENCEFQIRQAGATIATVGLQDLLEMNVQEFATTFASSAGLHGEITLRGVELRDLLDTLTIDDREPSGYVFVGLDGYASPLTAAEACTENLIYICYSVDGEILKPRSEGGYGPYMMVIRGSRFAQRWCKYVEAVDIIYD